MWVGIFPGYGGNSQDQHAGFHGSAEALIFVEASCGNNSRAPRCNKNRAVPSRFDAVNDLARFENADLSSALRDYDPD